MAEETAKMYVSVEAKFDEAINQLKLLTKELTKSSKGIDTFEKITEKLDSVLKVASGETSVNNQMFETLNSTVKVLDVSIGKLNNSIESLTKKSNNVYKSVEKTIDPLRKQTKALNDAAAQANRFNTGNIAAQAQDIFVTAQMNMRPITIGLQQGTQLLYVLQQSKAPLQEFIVGIKSLFSPLSLAVVGLTTLVAAFIQWVNWGKIGKTIAEGLAKSFKALGLIKISKWFESLVDSSDKAWASIKRLLDLTRNFDDEMNDLANKKFILETELYNPDNLSAKALKEEIYSMEKYYELTKKLDDEKRKFINENSDKKDYNELYGSYMEEYKETKKAIEGQARDYAKLRIENEDLQEKINERNKKEKESLGIIKKQVKEFDKFVNSYNEIFEKQFSEFENKQFEDSLEGLTTYEKTYRTVVHDMTKDIEDLKLEAIEAGIPLNKINEIFAGSTTKIEDAARAEAEYRSEKERTREELELYNSVMEKAQSETSTFFKDMRHGLRDGQNAWEAFGNAVNNVLDKILDKLIDIGVEAAFNGISAGGGGKDGWLGSLIKAGTSYFTAPGSGKQVYSSAIGPTTTGSNILGASAGGAFSNGVYSSPTVFKFAKGDKFGVMGEAGPEAVIPLKRAHDGSLGVSADGVGGSPVVVNVINNSNAQARTERRQTDQGVEIDVLIDEMIGKKLNTDGTASNTALKAYNNRQLIMR